MNFEPMKLKQDTPKVGVGVIIIHNEKLLLMHRKGSHGSGTWSLPGGHVDLGEELEPCCIREVKEELGIKLDSVLPYEFRNAIMPEEGLHYVTLFFLGMYSEDEVKKAMIMEPDKCSEIRWFPVDNLPANLFAALAALVDSVDMLTQGNEAALTE